MKTLLQDPYLSRHLIAYIGNKRRLLPFLGEVFLRLKEEGDLKSFRDPFAGSGGVSRLARHLGFETAAGDWEFYSFLVSAAHVTVDAREAESLFGSRGGMEAVFEELNRYGYAESEASCPYISRHYAPADTDSADFRTERLFYTRENGVFLDRVREKIEEWYPGWGVLTPPPFWESPEMPFGAGEGRSLSEEELKEKILLTSAVLYQAATRANTSGVFKAFHKGFGGHGKDALKRILSPMVLEPPVLTDSGAGRALWSDAENFAAALPGDLYYLDPPYNIHQYGSNYHLLNTLALWDKPQIDSRRREGGILAAKAGIRTDWKRTRSPYCSASTASSSLSSLLDKIDARTIVLSYSTDGIIPFEELMDILSPRGEVELHCRDYVKYRGGKQSQGRKNLNIEFQWVVKCGNPSGTEGRRKAERFLLEYRLVNLFQESFVPERLFESLSLQEDRLVWEPPGGPPLLFGHRRGYRLVDPPNRTVLGQYTDQDLASLKTLLSGAACRDRAEEAEVLLGILVQDLPAKERRFFTRRFFISLRKLAHKKTRDKFEVLLSQAVAADLPEGGEAFDNALGELERIAGMRFNH